MLMYEILFETVISAMKDSKIQAEKLIKGALRKQEFYLKKH